jgi:hypothetical protein
MNPENLPPFPTNISRHNNPGKVIPWEYKSQQIYKKKIQTRFSWVCTWGILKTHNILHASKRYLKDPEGLGKYNNTEVKYGIFTAAARHLAPAVGKLSLKINILNICASFTYTSYCHGKCPWQKECVAMIFAYINLSLQNKKNLSFQLKNLTMTP